VNGLQSDGEGIGVLPHHGHGGDHVCGS